MGCMAYRFRWVYSGDRKQRRLPRSGGRSAADCCEAIFFRRDRFDLVTTLTFLDDLITQVYSPTAPSILAFLGRICTARASASYKLLGLLLVLSRNVAMSCIVFVVHSTGFQISNCIEFRTSRLEGFADRNMLNSLFHDECISERVRGEMGGGTRMDVL